ncbi:MAG TPA: DUF29 domain-containing protein [Stellaceae bacterium]|jgi:hypothetical protein|nr:DUF29 domain-containing protein [Stellaceae bacterium]
MTDATLYDEDFVAWSQQQAEALRAAARTGSNHLLDWENLAEEIESLGISEKRELRSHIRRVIHHLLKLEHSRATEPRQGWMESIDDARAEIELVLETSPSLRPYVTTAIAAEMKHGVRLAVRDLEKYGAADPAAIARIHATTYTPDQILGDWFPEEPKP